MSAVTRPESVNDVWCSRCHAKAGQGCETPSGNPANEPHKARVDAYWAAIGMDDHWSESPDIEAGDR